jgi:hypothetical protein
MEYLGNAKTDTNAMLKKFETLVDMQGETLWDYHGKTPDLNIAVLISKTPSGEWKAKIRSKLGVCQKSFTSLKDLYANVEIFRDVIHGKLDDHVKAWAKKSCIEL